MTEERFVQQHPEQTDEVALVRADDVLKRTQDRAYVPGTESCSCSAVSWRQCAMSLSVAQTS